jgi:hypothetical protein
LPRTGCTDLPTGV